MKTRLGLVALALIGASALWAADPPPPPALPVPDPTVASPKLRREMDAAQVPNAAVQKMPAIALKGRVVSKGRPSVALVEVDGKIFTVAPGMTVLTAGGVQTLKFTEISTTEVRIEINVPKETISLN